MKEPDLTPGLIYDGQLEFQPTRAYPDPLRGSPGPHLLVGFRHFHLQVVALLVSPLNLTVDLPTHLLKWQRQLVTCEIMSWGPVRVGLVPVPEAPALFWAWRLEDRCRPCSSAAPPPAAAPPPPGGPWRWTASNSAQRQTQHQPTGHLNLNLFFFFNISQFGTIPLSYAPLNHLFDIKWKTLRTLLLDPDWTTWPSDSLPR